MDGEHPRHGPAESGFYTTRLLSRGDGSLFLYQRREQARIDEFLTAYEWVRSRLDPETLEVIAVEILPADWLDEPIAVGFEGETYIGRPDDILVMEADGERHVFAGSGLEGMVDSAGAQLAEFIFPERMWIDPEGGVRILDYDNAAVPVIRQVATAVPAPEVTIAEPERPAPPRQPLRRDW